MTELWCDRCAIFDDLAHWRYVGRAGIVGDRGLIASAKAWRHAPCNWLALRVLHSQPTAE